MGYCEKCGYELDDDALAFCESCGAPVHETAGVEPEAFPEPDTVPGESKWEEDDENETIKKVIAVLVVLSLLPSISVGGIAVTSVAALSSLSVFPSLPALELLAFPSDLQFGQDFLPKLPGGARGSDSPTDSLGSDQSASEEAPYPQGASEGASGSAAGPNAGEASSNGSEDASAGSSEGPGLHADENARSEAAAGTSIGEYAPLTSQFNIASSSSVLPGDSTTPYYGPYNVLDGDPTTAWNEGASNNGSGEWISLSAASPQTVSQVLIMGGFPKMNDTNGDVYYLNNRPRMVTIVYSGGYEQFELADIRGEYQVLQFKQPVKTDNIMIVINSVYKGASYNDCCIADVLLR